MATSEELEVAIEWLGINEGDEGEREACQAAIKFIRSVLDRRIVEAAIREVAKKSGRPTSDVRKALRARAAIASIPDERGGVS